MNQINIHLFRPGIPNNDFTILADSMDGIYALLANEGYDNPRATTIEVGIHICEPWEPTINGETYWVYF